MIEKNQLFIGLFLCQYLLDRTTSSCHSFKGEILLFLHHLFTLYLYFGSFFFGPKNHLILSLVVLIHWISYKRCILTIYTNQYCGVDIKRPFNDYIRMFGLHHIHKKIHWFLIIFVIMYDLFLIYK